MLLGSVKKVAILLLAVGIVVVVGNIVMGHGLAHAADCDNWGNCWDYYFPTVSWPQFWQYGEWW